MSIQSALQHGRVYTLDAHSLSLIENPRVNHFLHTSLYAVNQAISLCCVYLSDGPLSCSYSCTRYGRHTHPTPISQKNIAERERGRALTKQYNIYVKHYSNNVTCEHSNVWLSCIFLLHNYDMSVTLQDQY